VDNVPLKRAQSPEEKKVKLESPPRIEAIPKEEEVKLPPPPVIQARKAYVAPRQLQIQELRTKRNNILEKRRNLMDDIWNVTHQLDLAKFELAAIESRRRNAVMEIERHAKNQWVLIEDVVMI